MLDTYDYERLLKEYTPLLHRILLDIYHRQDHPSYEDGLQELRLELCRLVGRFGSDPLADEDTRYRFTAYARKALTRYLLKIHQQQLGGLALVDLTFAQDVADQDDFGYYDLTQDLNQVSQSLNANDRHLLHGLISEQFNRHELADQLGISYNALTKRLKKIQHKLQDWRDGRA